MNKTLARIFGLALLVTALPALADLEWGFDTGANPVAGVGGGTATITQGPFGDPYQSGNPGGFGTQSGYWDLGEGGSIVLSGLNLSGSYTLSVNQWVDSPFYSGALTATVPSLSGGNPFALSFQTIIESTTPFGNWEQYGASLNLLASDNITITAPGGQFGGAVVDRVTLTVVPEPSTTLMAGGLLLLPFAFSTIRIICRNKSAAKET